MPPRLSKPTDVPADHQQLIEALWLFYVAAGDPPMQTIARTIEDLDDEQKKGTANHETVRRTLKAISLPTWGTVEVIFLALCQLANIDPDDIEPDEDRGQWDPPAQSHRERLRTCYRIAKYGSAPPLPRTRAEKAWQEAEEAAARGLGIRRSAPNPWTDPWGSSSKPSSDDDEPPF